MSRGCFQIVLAILTGLGMLSVAGCVPLSHHEGSDLSKLDSFKIEKHHTTEQELVEHFGPPMSTTTRGDGARILTWHDTSSSGSMNLASGLPIAGAFMGPGVHQDVNSRSLTATIRDGVVVDYIVTDGKRKLDV